MDTLTVVTAGGFAAVLLEGLKFAWRKWVVKSDDFDFPFSFYAVAIPVLSFALVPLLGFLMVEGYAIPADWVAWTKQLVVTLISSMIAVGSYEGGIKPLKEYRKRL